MYAKFLWDDHEPKVSLGGAQLKALLEGDQTELDVMGKTIAVAVWGLRYIVMLIIELIHFLILIDYRNHSFFDFH